MAQSVTEFAPLAIVPSRSKAHPDEARPMLPPVGVDAEATNQQLYPRGPDRPPQRHPVNKHGSEANGADLLLPYTF